MAQQQSPTLATKKWSIPESYQLEVLTWLKEKLGAVAEGQLDSSALAETIKAAWVSALLNAMSHAAEVQETEHASRYQCVKRRNDDYSAPDDDLGWMECGGSPDG